jgi:pyruvate dehydrogenase E2 component (dihydrolipoamide acetyltransferase)
MIEITMPRLSDTMEEGTIASWRKQIGDAVKVGDILCDIESDKATMEFEAYDAGVLTEIVVATGEVAAIGALIARLDDGKGVSAPAPTVATATPSVAAPATTPATDTVTAPAPAMQAEHEDTADRLGVLASPLVRRLAREQGIDLATVRGTGPGGRIIRTDLDLATPSPEFLAPKGPAMPMASGPFTDDKRGTTDIPITPVRRVIARRLGESTRNTPHFYVTASADAEELVTLRARLNEHLEATGRPKVTINDLLIKACALALREHPLVNASYVSDTSPTMQVHERINIGVAVASNNGLVVPVVVDADRKSVSELGAEAKQLVTLASTKGLSIEQMSGGTFTISNLGMFGVEQFTAIINPPEGAILAVGGTKKEPLVVGDEIVARHVMRYTLSADHRIIDGALAAKFLQSLTRLIENPLALIA